MVGDSNWLACLEAVDNDKCPHGFLKIDDDSTGCYDGGICCLLSPPINLKVKG